MGWQVAPHQRENRAGSHDMLLVACCDDIVWGYGGAKLTKGTDLKEQGTSQLSEKLTNQIWDISAMLIKIFPN